MTSDDTHRSLGRRRMINVALVGATDPRSRWFLAAAQRRRAGVRIVGLSEPDPAARSEIARLYDLPAWDDHRTMLAETSPTLVAVATPDAGPVPIDALRHNADVLVAPPICATTDQLGLIAELAADRGRRVTAALTYRGHPAVRTAAELVERMGRPELISLVLSGDRSGEEQRASIMDGLDVFQILTASAASTVTKISDDHPARVGDDPEVRNALGELILIATTGPTADSDGPVFEVRRQRGDAERRDVIQVCGERGAIEWDTRAGMMRSAFDGRSPITVSCGLPDQPEWVLNNLIRKPHPVVSTDYSLALMGMLLTAEDSAL